MAREGERWKEQERKGRGKEEGETEKKMEGVLPTQIPASAHAASRLYNTLFVNSCVCPRCQIRPLRHFLQDERVSDRIGLNWLGSTC